MVNGHHLFHKSYIIYINYYNRIVNLDDLRISCYNDGCMDKKPKKLVPNPERGHRGDFERLTITMPPEMVEDLEIIRRQRKRAKEKNTDISRIIREVVAFWLDKK
jgi:hypothetical protein